MFVATKSLSGESSNLRTKASMYMSASIRLWALRASLFLVSIPLGAGVACSRDQGPRHESSSPENRPPNQESFAAQHELSSPVTAVPSRDSPYKQLSTTPIASVAIPIALGDDLGFMLEHRLGSPSTTYWDVPKAVAQLILDGLDSFLRNEGSHDAATLAARLQSEHSSSYRVQFLGGVVGGRRVVYGNFFCAIDGRHSEWMSRPIMVKDGGSCFFQVIFDMTTKSYLELHIQGRP